MIVNIVRTNSSNLDFKNLVSALDADLIRRDGEEHAFYSQFNTIENLNHVVVAYIDKQAIGCGAIKVFDSQAMEVKRMFTDPLFRGKGIASKILMNLENWAVELKTKRCVLETGIKQPEAWALYKKMGYQQIPNYGQYANVENSVCFEKILKPS